MSGEASPPVPRRPLLGILGGMGPLASAEFLKTFYRFNLADPEQGSGECVLLSVPSFPDRTAALLEGRRETLVVALEDGLRRLQAAGATRTVVTCFTVHAVLAALDPSLSKSLISLVHLALYEAACQPARRLLLATVGATSAGVFQADELWPSVAESCLVPDQHDQLALHELLYELKRGRGDCEILQWLEVQRRKYQVDGFVMGCTELHLIAHDLFQSEPDLAARSIDPLTALARAWARSGEAP
jgi:aspartate racemase